MPTEQPTSVRLPKDLKDFLREQAKEARRPLTYQIIYILNEYRKAIVGFRKTSQK
jgi:predicted DNA-binding protein